MIQRHYFKCKICLLRWEQWVGYDERVPKLQCPDCEMGVDKIHSAGVDHDTLVRIAEWKETKIT